MSNIFYAKAKAGLLEFSNKREIFDFLLENDNKEFEVTLRRTTGVRTFDQNSALHKYFELLADALNDAGLTVQAVLEKKIELNWTPEMIKELLWREVQMRLYGKKSTTKLDKVGEIDNIHDHLTRHLGEKFGLEYIPFPCDHEKQLNKLK